MKRFMRGLLEYFKKNIYMFAVVTKIVLLMTGIIANSLCARFLGQYYKGISSYISSILSVVVIIAVFGMHQAYPYYRRELGKAFIKSYYGAVQLVVVMYSVIAVFVCVKFSIFSTTGMVAVLSPIMVYAKMISYSALVEKPGMRNVIELSVSVIDIIVVLLLYLFTVPNMQWLLLILALKYLLEIFFYSKIQCVKLRISLSSAVYLKEMVIFGFIPMISQVMTNLNYRIDVFMLKRFTTLEEIGVYSVGVSLVEQCWIIPETVRDILVSRLVNGKKEEEVAAVIRISNTIVCIVAILIILLGKVVISILYGKEFIMAYPVAVIELIGVLGMVSMKMVSTYNIVLNNQKINLIFMIIGILINVFINSMLIPLWGINGAAIATLISYTVNGILFVAYFVGKNAVPIKDVLIINKNDVQKFIAGLKKTYK